MAILNYTYLKLKMPGPNGVITIHTTYQHAYECDVECCEYAKAIIESEALAIELEARIKETPNPKWTIGSFEPAKGVKEFPLTPAALTARLCALAPPWIPNRKQCSSTFSAQTVTCSRGVLCTCLTSRGKSPSTAWISGPTPN
jgi:hypothetical protein